MEPIVNEHGVIINFETTKIVDCKEGIIEIHHIEHEGKMYATLSMDVYHMGMGSYPSFDDEVKSFADFIFKKFDYIRDYLSRSEYRQNQIILKQFEDY